jgi:uncharacterized phage-associated protein
MYNRWKREGVIVSQVFSLAKELVKLSLSGEERDPLTNLRLQKLLYYAQAWSLVIRERELFSEEIVAWRHGPVVPVVYRALPGGIGACAIPADSFTGVPDLEPEDAAFMKSVWEAYNPYSALKLSRMTHEELPWQKAWGGRPRDGHGDDPIRIEDLEDFFGKQTVPAPLETYRQELRRKEEEAAKRLLVIPALDTDRLVAAAKSYTPAARQFKATGG